MNIGVIIQARMGSTRLPGKVLKQLDNKTVLSYVVERCKLMNHINEIIVATTISSEDDAIVEWCIANDVAYFRGSENNVLERYIQCAEKYNLEYIIRVTADCPFVDFEIANEVIELAIQDDDFDIWVIRENWSRGLAIELVKLKALKEISQLVMEEKYLEHVTLYLYQNGINFIRKNFEVSGDRKYPQFRLTIDTIEDFLVCSLIAKNFKNTSVSCFDIFEFLLVNPEISNLNNTIQQSIVSGNN